MEKEQEQVSKETAMVELKKGYAKAKQVIDGDKIDELLLRLEEKLKAVPKIGEKLSHIAVFMAMLKSYVTKEYTKIPLGTLTAIVSAVLYVISPGDLIADFIPALGYVDDVAVVTACFCLVETDVQEYLVWRELNKKAELHKNNSAFE